MKFPAALVLLALGARAETSVPTTAEVLAANHVAMGDPAPSGGAEFDYAYRGSGLVGTRRDQVDLASGWYIEAEQAGGIAEARGYDGATPWMRDLSGANTAEEGGDRIPLAVNEAYRLARRWWSADRGGAAIAYVGRDTTDGQTTDLLRIKPVGGKPFEARFDVHTHLLVQVAEEQEFFATVTSYRDYRREQGLLVAHAVTLDGGAGPDSIETLQLSTVILGGAHARAFYARPSGPPEGGAIEDGATSVTLPIRVLNNHVYLEARVNGHGPYTFIVDTGGHTLLAPHLVADAGLHSVGAAAASGAGEGTAVSGFAAVGDLALGALHLRQQMGFTEKIYDASIEGIAVDGMIGFEVFRRFTVRIDYGRKTITFIDPRHFDPAGAGEPIRFKFYDHLPYLEGFIDDLPARLDLDTGSRSEVDITRPFVERHQLRARFASGVRAITGWGVGGPVRAYVVRLPSLTVGAVTGMSVVAGLSESRHGTFSDANFDGNVGSGFLKRFVATFDYAHQILYLKAISPVPADTGRFDRSGMWLNAESGGYQVTDVTPGGPAAAAGLAAGDVIVTLDGAPAHAEGLSDARALLRDRPAATAVLVQFRRGSMLQTAAVLLRDQI